MSISKSRWVVLLLALVLAATVVTVWGFGTAGAKEKTQGTTQTQGAAQPDAAAAVKTDSKTGKKDSVVEGGKTVKATDKRPVDSMSVDQGGHPFIPTDAAAYKREKEAVESGTATGVPKGNTPESPNTSSGASPQLSTSTPVTLTSDDDQSSAGYGWDAPADTQFAAGPNHYVEFVNHSGAFYSKSTNSRLLFINLDNTALFPGPSSFTNVFDPQVLYDANQGRWIISSVQQDPQTRNSQVDISVSQTSDPTGNWYAYQFDTTSNGMLHDRPMLGVNKDKVVASWNDVCQSSACGTVGGFYGSTTSVISYQDLMNGAAAPYVTEFSGDQISSNIVPARTLDNSTTEYATYNLRFDPSYPNGKNGYYTGVFAITGSPANGGTVYRSEYDINKNSTTSPPKAQQPGGGKTIETADDRYTTAVEEGGVLWTGGNLACLPTGDTTNRSCLNLVQVNVSGSSPTLVKDSFVAQPGKYLYYPTMTMDGNKDMFVTYSDSSSSVYPEARAAELPAGSSSLSSPVTLKAGQQVYSGHTETDNALYWGDFCGAGPDPTSNTSISSNTAWVACQYSKSSSNGDNWGTVGEKLTG